MSFCRSAAAAAIVVVVVAAVVVVVVVLDCSSFIIYIFPSFCRRSSSFVPLLFLHTYAYSRYLYGFSYSCVLVGICCVAFDRTPKPFLLRP